MTIGVFGVFAGGGARATFRRLEQSQARVWTAHAGFLAPLVKAWGFGMTQLRGSQRPKSGLHAGGSGGGTRGVLLVHVGMDVVAHVGALHPENHVFGDVGGVIGNALEIAGDE
jgi:hypothetical protein